MFAAIIDKLGDFAIDYLGDRLLDDALATSIKGKLAKETKIWASQLRENLAVDPDAIFPPAIEDGVTLPKLKHIEQKLKEGDIPSKTEWGEALLERWYQVRESVPHKERQKFFQATEAEVSPHLQELGRRLELICNREPALVQPTLLKRTLGIASIQADVSEIKHQFLNDARLRQLSHERVEWDELHMSYLPILGAGEDGVDAYMNHIFVCLHEEYAANPYTRFLAFATVGERTVRRNGVDVKVKVVGVDTTRVSFAAAMTRKIRAIIAKVPGAREEYQRQVDFLLQNWSCRYEEITANWPFVYEFIVDAEARSMSIKCLEIDDSVVTISSQMTTEDAMVNLMRLMGPNRVRRLDYRSSHPAMDKVLCYMVDTGKLHVSRLRFNRHNTQQFDFVYDLDGADRG